MRLSTRTRYGVRIILCLAMYEGRGPVFLKEIARKEGISEKYLSQIIIPLRVDGLVSAFRGSKGGYSLSRNASKITMLDIYKALEGETQFADCSEDPGICEKSQYCVTKDLWCEMFQRMTGFMSEHTLEELVRKQEFLDHKQIESGNYSI